MAIWVQIEKAEKFTAVHRVYQRTDEFRAAAKADARGSAVWARKPPGITNQSLSNIQVDVTAIPGVPALRASGHKK